MRKRCFRMAMAAMVLIAVTYPATLALAQTRLFVPQYRFSDSEDTQFLLANQNDHDVVVDLWAFTSAGELLGQFQMPVKAHGTRALTLGEALQLKGTSVSGWIGAVAQEDGVQLSYTRLGATPESFEAQPWAGREMSLSVSDRDRQVVRVSNPNPFAASLTITGSDQAGQYVGTQQVAVGPFGQVELPVTSVIGGQATRLRVASNADVLAAVDSPMNSRNRGRLPVDEGAIDSLALVINSEVGIGAYQITLTYDPRLVQFSSKDVEGGTAEGFDSKPLVVNIDNVAGQMTIASFQVGARPDGRTVIAKLRAPAGVRFGIKVDEITDTAGNSLSGLSVGMVRTR